MMEMKTAMNSNWDIEVTRFAKSFLVIANLRCSHAFRSAAPFELLPLGHKKSAMPTFCDWWRWRELNPRPSVLRHRLYMFSLSII